MKKRHLYIEVLRILACLAVLFNHASGFFLFGDREPGGLLYRLDMGLSICSTFAVPAFFAISGALLLGKEIRLDKRFVVRFMNMAVTLVVFSVVSYMIDMVQDGQALDMKTMIFRLYEDNLNFSYWYLYAYLAFLLISPLLSAMLRSLKDKEILYMLGLAFVARCALPAFETWRWAGAHQLNRDFSLACISCDIVLYPTMGYFLHHRMSVKACRKWAPVLVLGALLSVLVCIELMLQAYYRTWVPKVEPITDPARLLLGAAAYASARALFGEWQSEGRLARALSYAGSLTFGIYLLHVPVLHSSAMGAFMDAIRAALPMPLMLYSLIEVLMTALVSGVIAALLRKIPGIKRLLGA